MLEQGVRRGLRTLCEVSQDILDVFLVPGLNDCAPVPVCKHPQSPDVIAEEEDDNLLKRRWTIQLLRPVLQGAEMSHRAFVYA